MTKKHFEAIAAQFAKAKPLPPGDAAWNARYAGRVVQWENDVVVIADALAASNPRFNRTRFYVACGVDEAVR